MVKDSGSGSETLLAWAPLQALLLSKCMNVGQLFTLQTALVTKAHGPGTVPGGSDVGRTLETEWALNASF